MPASRLAIQQLVSPHVISSAVDLEQVSHEIKRRMSAELGLKLIEELSAAITPMVVRLVWQEEDDWHDWPGGKVFRLIAQMNPVHSMEIQELRLPPFEFVSYPEPHRAVIEWQCSWCGQVNLIEQLECRRCGGPRKVLR